MPGFHIARSTADRGLAVKMHRHDVACILGHAACMHAIHGMGGQTDI